MTPTRQEIADVAGCDSDFVSNIVNRGLLNSKLPKTSAGVARDFTRVNALEISFITALVAIGRAPIVAGEIVSDWVKREKKGDLPPWWVENPKTGNGTFLAEAPEKMTVAQFFRDDTFADDIGSGELLNENSDLHAKGHKSASCISFIHVADIVRRVDELFSAP